MTSNSDNKSNLQSTKEQITIIRYYDKDEKKFLQSLENLFDDIDFNHDGIISEQEIQAALRKLNLPDNQRQIQKIFDKVGVQKKDLKMTRNEFQNYLHQQYIEIKQIFESFDKQKKGSINENDIHQYLKQIHKEMTPLQIQHIIKYADKTQHGSIEFEDFYRLFYLIPELQQQILFDLWSRQALDPKTIPQGQIHLQGNSIDGLITFLAGLCSASISKTLTSPLNRLKIMMQVDTSNAPTTIMQGLKNIYLQDGIKGFYRGNIANIMRYGPEFTCKFFFYDKFIKKLNKANSQSKPLLHHQILAGGMAGAIAQTTVYPLEITLTRLSLSKKEEFQGILDCLNKTYKNEGINIIFRGLSITLIGYIPFSAIELSVYYSLRDYYIRNNDGLPSSLTLAQCGAFSSMTAQLICYPSVVVRTRLQAQGIKDRPTVYKGAIDCAYQTYQKEGFFKGFYKGFGANLLKSIPSIYISYGAFEYFKRIFSQKLRNA